MNERSGQTAPDFREVARVLGVDRSRELARRAQLVLAGLLEEASRVERALAPVLSSKGGTLRICGTTAEGKASLSWDETRGRSALRAPADFYLESTAEKSRKRYQGQTSFVALSSLSAQGELDAGRVLLEQLRGADADLYAALRDQFPSLYAFLERLADLEHTSVVRDGADHIEIRLHAPLNRAAIKAHYPSIDRLHGWIKELDVAIADPQGRVLGRISFDGSRRVFCFDAYACGGELLWGDDRGPLRDQEGRLVPLTFRLTESHSFQLHARVTTALFRLGRLRLGSCRLPDSRWDLEFVGNDLGDRALWRVRTGFIGPPGAPLKWLLPLERIFRVFEESFHLRISLVPRAGEEDLHELEIEYGAQTPRSPLLDLLETLLRWGTRSSAFRGLLGVWHDLADSLARDLEALAPSEPPRSE